MKPQSESLGRVRHPLHAAAAHFPMALLAISSLWDLLGMWQGDAAWWKFAFWSIAAGLLFAIAALITGIIDFIKIPQGEAAEKTAMRHMAFMIAAVFLYVGSFMVRYREPVVTGQLQIAALALSAVGLILLIIGGWHGGELVYRFGIGRSDPPSPTQEERH